MTEFTVETVAFRQALATALVFAATDAEVPMIYKVHVKPASEDRIEFAATDRYMLSVETVKATGEPFEFGIPVPVAKRLVALLPKPTRRANLLDNLTAISRDAEAETVTVRIVGDVTTSITFTPEDGFIDYRELVKKLEADRGEPDGLVALSSPNLARVGKALAARGESYEPVKVQVGGPRKPVTFTHGTDFMGLVMPMRRAEEEAVEPLRRTA